MPEVREQRHLDAPAAEVWARIGDFHRLHTWHPVIANVEPGPAPDLRIATLVNGHQATEHLVEQGDTWHSYEPADPSRSLPGYRSTIRVLQDGPGACTVEWVGTFEADGAQADAFAAQISGFYRAGLDSL
jgi:hypothetical protein